MQPWEDSMQFWHWLGTTQGIVTCAVMVLIFALAAIMQRGPWRNYVGVGFVLGYYGENKALKGVYVLSLLLDSPAHRGGVKKWDRVLTYAGRAMDFAKPNELTATVTAITRTLKPGDKVVCMLQRDDKVFEVTLEAAVIRGTIPVHLPQVFPSPNDADYGDYHYGMVYDLRTGEWVPTMGLSDERISFLFGK